LIYRQKILSRFSAGCWWLMPIILATQEAEIRDRSSKPAWANSSARPYLEKPFTKIDWWSGSRWSPWAQVPVPQKKKNYIFKLLNFCNHF
jgi:hypothetical protein